MIKNSDRRGEHSAREQLASRVRATSPDSRSSMYVMFFFLLLSITPISRFGIEWLQDSIMKKKVQCVEFCRNVSSQF